MFTDGIVGLRMPAVAAAALAGVVLAACGGAPKGPVAGAELEWARAALARNAALEVVAVDENARAFTIRDKATGELRVVRLDELVAAPLTKSTAVAAAGGSGTSATSAAAPASAAPSGGAAADASSGAAAAAVTAAGSKGAGETASVSGGAVASVGQAGPGGPASPAETIAAGGGEYAVERNRNGVKITGPGVSIVSAGRSDTAPGSARPDAAAAAAPSGSGPGLERRNEPLHCQGSKFLRLDGQRLAFAGDGIVAERGCELYLTNSRVEALGNALVVNGAKVHVTNSTIVGGTGSLELRNGAEAYVGGSTLKGMSRRFDTSQLHDLGANQWN